MASLPAALDSGLEPVLCSPTADQTYRGTNGYWRRRGPLEPDRLIVDLEDKSPSQLHKYARCWARLPGRSHSSLFHDAVLMGHLGPER